MADAQSLASQVSVVYREPGLLRLALPKAWCQPGLAAAIEAGLGVEAGIRRVSVDLPAGRLTLRYDREQTSVAQLAQALNGILAAHLSVPEEAVATGPSSSASLQPQTLPAPLKLLLGGQAQPWLDRGRRLFEQLRGQPDDASGAGLASRLQPIFAGALTERAVLNFLNDLTAFYLVKVHWELISKRWLREPLKFQNAWLTTFYLVFLLVRFRKRAARQAAAEQA